MQNLGKHRGVLGLPLLSIPLELQLRRQLSFSEDSDLSSDDILERSSQKSRREVCRVKLSPNLWVVLVGIPAQGGTSVASSDCPVDPGLNAHKGSASLGLLLTAGAYLFQWQEFLCFFLGKKTETFMLKDSLDF